MLLQYADFLAVTSENLRVMRRLSGLTQEDVAEALLLSRSAYAGTEQGRTCVGFYNAYLLSHLYNVPMELFTKEKQDAKIILRILSL